MPEWVLQARRVLKPGELAATAWAVRARSNLGGALPFTAFS